jgi:CelD/BcsL family acetyltransferase involved in cellulose biosynthesis
MVGLCGRSSGRFATSWGRTDYDVLGKHKDKKVNRTPETIGGVTNKLELSQKEVNELMNAIIDNMRQQMRLGRMKTEIDEATQTVLEDLFNEELI